MNIKSKFNDNINFLIGIDDAGRGPVIGPMVLAGVLIKKEDESFLKELGAKDSKQVSAEDREIIANKLKEKFEYHFELTSADEIDLKTKSGVNLNRIEALKAARIINKLIEGKQEKTRVIIDCPSPNTESWREFVIAYIDKNNKDKIELVCEHKADVNHLVCSAASIIAKTTRDSEIEKLKKQVGFDFGSGYCHDPLTCKALENNLEELEKHGIIRKTWKTFDTAKAKKEQKSLF